MAIARTPIHDDDGTGFTGTIIDNAWKQELYDQIDAADASSSVTLPVDLTTQVTGTLQAAQEPAHTGDVSNAAGSLALTIGAGKVTDAMLAGNISTAKLTGTLQAAQEPAHSGDVTNAAGSLALAIGAGKVTNAMIASGIAETKITPPAPVVLTDGATVAIDVLGRAPYYRLVAAGDRTLAQPTNPYDGQRLVIMHVASGGARTLTLAGSTFGFRFGADIASLTTTASGKTDYIGCIYNSTDQRWDVVAYTKGF